MSTVTLILLFLISKRNLASNAMTRRQTIFCFSVREPDTALSRLAIQVSFEHSISSPSLLFLREGKKNIQTNDRQMTRQKVSPQFGVDRSSARQDRDCGRATASRRRLLLLSTGTVLLPSQMSQLAGHDVSGRFRRFLKNSTCIYSVFAATVWCGEPLDLQLKHIQQPAKNCSFRAQLLKKQIQ